MMGIMCLPTKKGTQKTKRDAKTSLEHKNIRKIFKKGIKNNSDKIFFLKIRLLEMPLKFKVVLYYKPTMI
jgi:hypothetical protein